MPKENNFNEERIDEVQIDNLPPETIQALIELRRVIQRIHDRLVAEEHAIPYQTPINTYEERKQ